MAINPPKFRIDGIEGVYVITHVDIRGCLTMAEVMPDGTVNTDSPLLASKNELTRV